MHQGKLYKVIFKGQLVQENSSFLQKQKIAKTINLNSKDFDNFFSGKLIELKSGLTLLEASTLEKKLKSIGLIVYVEDDDLDLTIKIHEPKKQRTGLFLSVFIPVTIIGVIIYFAFAVKVSREKSMALYYLEQQYNAQDR